MEEEKNKISEIDNIKIEEEKENKNNNDSQSNRYNIRRTYNELIPIVKEILKKGIRHRTPKDTSNLNEFLELTRFSYNMKEEIEEGNLDLNQLIFFSTQFMNFEYFNKGDIIYYEGDKAENFYVLIKGNVNLFKLNFQTKQMTAFEYYKYLQYYHENIKDIFVLNETVKANNNIFPVYDNLDIPKFDEIIFKVNLLNLIYKGVSKNNILSFINNNDKNPEDYYYDDLDKDELTMDEYYIILQSKLTDSENFYFTKVKNESKRVKIMENNISKTLIEKEYFGLFKLEEGGNIRRNTAIIESDNTLLLVVNKKLYSGCISNEQLLIKENEVDKIYFGTIFISVKRHNFEKYYFYNLDKVEFSKGEEIFSENEKLDYIYILKKGTIEINLLNKTVIDIKKLIKQFKDFDKSFLKKEFDDTLKLKNSLISMKNLIKQKNNYSLFIINTKETFGIWEYCFNNRYTCYNNKVKSDKAIFYKMNIDIFLEEIHEKIPDSELLKNHIKIDAYNQIKNYIERLIFLKNSILMKYDIEYSKIKKDEEKKLSNTKFNILDVKNSVKTINNFSDINPRLKKFLSISRHQKTKSMDIQNFKTLNNNSNNYLNNVICNKPLNTISSIKSYENDNNNNLNEKKKIFFDLNIEKYSYKNNYNKNSRNIKINSLYRMKTEKSKDSKIHKKSLIDFNNNKIIFPKIFYPRRIQNPSYLKLNEDIKEKEINNKNGNKKTILNDTFNINKEKNINYLAIRKFYHNFSHSIIKQSLNKSMK